MKGRRARPYQTATDLLPDHLTRRLKAKARTSPLRVPTIDLWKRKKPGDRPDFPLEPQDEDEGEYED